MKRVMEINTVQSGAFKILIEAIKEVLTETVIEVDETGMKIATVDNSHTVLIHIRMHAQNFEAFRCDIPRSIGVNLLNLHKIIKTISTNDILTFYMDEGEDNFLGIIIKNTERNTVTTYRLSLLDLDNEFLDIPPAKFQSMITIPSTDFQKIVRDMNQLAQYVEITSCGNQLTFKCDGDFCSQETLLSENKVPTTTTALAPDASTTKPLGNADTVLSDDEGDTNADTASYTDNSVSLDTATSNIVQGEFALKYLVTFTRCTNLCNTVRVYLKNDYPIVINYDIATLGDIKLCLSPRAITNDVA